MSGGGGSQVVGKQTTEPWRGIQPYYKDVAGEASKLYRSGIGGNPYPGSTYIPPTNYEMQGMNQIANASRGPNKISQGLLGNMNALQGIASGKNMGINNADFRGLVNRSVASGVDSVNSMFSGGGRYGGGANQAGVQQTAGDIAGGMYANQYNQDIANQTNAAGLYGQLAPTANDSRYWNSQKLIDVGSAQRGEAQDELGANMSRWDQMQNAPWQRLGMYNNLLSGVGGTGGTTTSYAPRGSSIAGILGGGSMGLGILGQLFGLFGGG